MWKKRSTRGLIVTGLIILLVVALSYFGMNTGNFVIRIDNESEKRGLTLYESEENPLYTARLTASPVVDAWDAQYDDIPEEVQVGDGSKNDDKGRYLAYSFYLKNNGKETVDFTVNISIDKVTKNLDEILRLMIIREDEDGVTTKDIYAKVQSNGVLEDCYANSVTKLENVKGFAGNTIVNDLVKDFEVSQVYRYTVVMWLDGWDAQSDSSMLGGAIKLSMNFFLS